MVECKTTKHASFSLKQEELKLNRLHAMKAGQTAVFQVELAGSDRYAVIEWNVFLDMQKESERDGLSRRRVGEGEGEEGGEGGAGG